MYSVSNKDIFAIISIDEFREINYKNQLNKSNLVLISIGNPGESHTTLDKNTILDYKDILQIEFWDLEEDFGNYKILSDEQGKILQDFIIKNKDEQFIIHCSAGISRSAGVGKAVECIKYFGIGEESKYQYLTGFNSEISKHKRYSPNLTVFDKIIKEINDI